MLSDAKLRTLKPRTRPYKVSDAEGLFILVNPNGSRLWRWSYRYDGKQKTLALGKYPDVSLADARDKLRADIDPSQQRKEAKTQRRKENKNTFACVARRRPSLGRIRSRCPAAGALSASTSFRAITASRRKRSFTQFSVTPAHTAFPIWRAMRRAECDQTHQRS